MLVAKIKEWEVRRKAREVVATRLACWAARRRYLRQRRAATKIQATRRMALQRRKYKVELDLTLIRMLTLPFNPNPTPAPAPVP